MPLVSSNRNNASGVSFVDVIIVTVMFLITLIISYSWESRLAYIFFGFSIAGLVIYLLSASTGLMSSLLNLKVPTWTISAALSAPIWIILSKIPSATSELKFSENALVRLFGAEFFNGITQGWVVPFFESLFLVVILVGIMVRFKDSGVDKPGYSFTRNKTKKNGFAWLGIMISAVGALLHYVIILEMMGGSFTFGYLMLHQFISFYIFVLFFFIFKAPGAVAPHLLKNLIVYGGLPGLVAAFVIFIALDLIALRSGGSARSTLAVRKSIGI